jgi:hypothetical protein
VEAFAWPTRARAELRDASIRRRTLAPRAFSSASRVRIDARVFDDASDHRDAPSPRATRVRLRCGAPTSAPRKRPGPSRRVGVRVFIWIVFIFFIFARAMINTLGKTHTTNVPNV